MVSCSPTQESTGPARARIVGEAAGRQQEGGIEVDSVGEGSRLCALA